MLARVSFPGKVKRRAQNHRQKKYKDGGHVDIKRPSCKRKTRRVHKEELHFVLAWEKDRRRERTKR